MKFNTAIAQLMVFVNAANKEDKLYVDYAKGFIHTAEAISVGQSGTFRYRLIGLWGIRRYYQKRKGETLLSPTEQQQVIAIARNLGLQRAEYFDAYVEEYDFT